MNKTVEKEQGTPWNPLRYLRKLYDWVLHWAETPYGLPALFFLAFAESSFFPVPPDVLLIALAISIPARAFRCALVCSVGSVLGGIFGYVIGWQFYEQIGIPILDFYHAQEKFQEVRQLYETYDFWVVFTAGFTPIPYKVFTIASGVFSMNFLKFLLASSVSRSARFFLVSGLIWYFGPSIKDFIDKYFNLLVIVFTMALIGGFVLIKYLF
ncbi:cytochrome B [candidate division KSB3 bacterium]|uniref:Cytochrome B n=1 Tax=candidate division KSB3 bacterium TaxID=2044937 RepID=A0A2G6EA62_9BACT|nr:MAG: cytochrome B [candidate division KSB3 bacterium]PIE29596.1 MAG: cytochrome B [candidate division KSB3 bacterium]